MSVKVSSDVHPSVQQAIEELQGQVAKPTVPHFTAAPLLGQVPQGSHVTAVVSGTAYTYFNVNGKLYRTALTAV